MSSNTLIRRIAARTVVLAGAGAIATLCVTTPAAQAGVSPFAGTFSGRDPQGIAPWVVTVSPTGRMSSSFSYDWGAWGSQKGSLDGSIAGHGGYSMRVSVTTRSVTCTELYCDPRLTTSRSSYKSTGAFQLDASGNLVGTTNDGRTFTWLRQ